MFPRIMPPEPVFEVMGKEQRHQGPALWIRMKGIAEMRMALLAPIAVTVATPLCLLKLAATFLCLAAVLTVAVNCLPEIFLGPLDALFALVVVVARLRTRHAARQQQYS